MDEAATDVQQGEKIHLHARIPIKIPKRKSTNVPELKNESYVQSPEIFQC